MKIAKKMRVSTTTDIGPLDGVCSCATVGRERLGMKTVCDACGQAIRASEDSRFVIALKKGHKNMMFHPACLDEHAGKMLDDYEARQKAKAQTGD